MPSPIINAELTRLETVIERGLDHLHEVGNDLLEIRDKKLYTAKYDTSTQQTRELAKLPAADQVPALEIATSERRMAEKEVEFLERGAMESRPLSPAYPEPATVDGPEIPGFHGMPDDLP